MYYYYFYLNTLIVVVSLSAAPCKFEHFIAKQQLHPFALVEHHIPNPSTLIYEGLFFIFNIFNMKTFHFYIGKRL